MTPTSNLILSAGVHPPACEAGRHCFGHCSTSASRYASAMSVARNAARTSPPQSRDRFINLRLKRSKRSQPPIRSNALVHSCLAPLCAMRTKGELKVNGEGDEQNEGQARRTPPGRAPNEEKTEAK